MDGEIAYVCVDPAHQTRRPQDSLTMHEDQWAYCPGAHAGDHTWRRTGGLDLIELKTALAKGTPA